MFLILIILNISQAQIHMLQRTQSLLIFLPVHGTSGDKSDIQRNHTWLTNQSINGKQRSFAKMTYSDIVTYHNQQYPAGLRQQGIESKSWGTPCQVSGTTGRLGHPPDACYPGMKRFYSRLPPPHSLPGRLALGIIPQLSPQPCYSPSSDT